MKLGRFFACAALGLALFFTAGCGVVSDVTAGISAAEAILPTLTALVDPSVVTAVTSYTTQAATFWSETSAELASSDSETVKVDTIAGYMLAVVKPNLPAGTPQNIVTALQDADTFIRDFVANLKAGATTVASLPYAESLKARSKGYTLKGLDAKKLAVLKARADKLAAKAKAPVKSSK
jgi:hypothetical protein